MRVAPTICGKALETLGIGEVGEGCSHHDMNCRRSLSRLAISPLHTTFRPSLVT